MAAPIRITHERGVEAREWTCVGVGSRPAGDFLVQAHSIIGTDIVQFTVWDLVTEVGSWGYGTVTKHDEYGWLGRHYTRASECELPNGAERETVVRAHYDRLRVEADQIIAAAYPELVPVMTPHEGNASCFTWEFSERVLGNRP